MRLAHRVAATDSRVCLGIDPRPDAHPLTDPDTHHNDPAKVARAVVHYFQAILDKTHDLIACVKPQSAFFERLGIPGLIALAQLIADAKSLELPVILDAKRSDIGSTSRAYADAYLADGVFGSDALTINPYLGTDSMHPFVETADANERGLFVLVKTSNPGSGDFQSLTTAAGRQVYEVVAERLTGLAEQRLDADGLSPIGAVVGATFPQELAQIRQQLPHSWILVPGYGAQGATASDVSGAFLAGGKAAVVSASRSLTHTTDDQTFARRAREAALVMRDEINAAIG